MVKGSSILVLASHDDALVKRLCNKVITLEHGQIKEIEEIN